MKNERRTRRDRVMAIAVDEGIVVMVRDGRNKAAADMLAAGIPFRVIGRVLSEQSRWRTPH